METLDTQTLAALAVLGVVIVLGLAAWLMYRRKQSYRLEQRFGPEYGRAVEQMGSRGKAESELMAREKRVSRLKIVPLPTAEAARFSHEWRGVQARFVDDPKAALLEADHLVRELMLRRGYPMADFEHRAADISVDHPAVVEHYRTAHDIALRAERSEADTEAMRQAVVHYRALFDDLLETEHDTRAAA